MKQLNCEICGGDVLLKEGDHFRCTQCGACYSPEQLKTMVAPPQAEPQPEECVQEEPAAQKPATEERRTVKRRGRTGPLWEIVVPCAVVVLFLVMVVLGSMNWPDKKMAKDCARDRLVDRYEFNGLTVENIRFDSVDAVKFQTRAEDPVGYFAHMEEPVKFLQEDGSYKEEYESRFAEVAEEYVGEYDPEATVKWAYTMVGSFEAIHPVEGKVFGEFRIVFVEDDNVWRELKSEMGPSLDMLRQDLRGYLTVYLQTSYDIKPNPQIKITSIDKDSRGDYTACGWVTVRDKYGEEYTGKFQAEYDCLDYEVRFEREEVTVETLMKNNLAG